MIAKISTLAVFVIVIILGVITQTGISSYGTIDSNTYLNLMAISFQVTFLTTTLLGGLSDKSEKLYWIVYPDEYLIKGRLNYENLSILSYLCLALEFVLYLMAPEKSLVNKFLFYSVFLVGNAAIFILGHRFSRVFFFRKNLLKKWGQKFDNDIKAKENGIQDDLEIEILSRCMTMYNHTVESVDSGKKDTRLIVENMCLLLRNSRDNDCKEWLGRMISYVAEKDEILMGQCVFLIMDEIKKHGGLLGTLSDSQQEVILSVLYRQKAIMEGFWRSGVLKSFWKSGVGAKSIQEWYCIREDELLKKCIVLDADNIPHKDETAIKEFETFAEPYLKLFGNIKGFKKELCSFVSKMHDITIESGMVFEEFSLSKRFSLKIFEGFKESVLNKNYEDSEKYIKWTLTEINKGKDIAHLIPEPGNGENHTTRSSWLHDLLYSEFVECIITLKDNPELYICMQKLSSDVQSSMYLFIADLLSEPKTDPNSVNDIYSSIYKSNESNELNKIWKKHTPGRIYASENIDYYRDKMSDNILETLRDYLKNRFLDMEKAVRSVIDRSDKSYQNLCESVFAYNTFVIRYIQWFIKNQDPGNYARFFSSVFLNSCYDPDQIVSENDTDFEPNRLWLIYQVFKAYDPEGDFAWDSLTKIWLYSDYYGVGNNTPEEQQTLCNEVRDFIKKVVSCISDGSDKENNYLLTGMFAGILSFSPIIEMLEREIDFYLEELKKKTNDKISLNFLSDILNRLIPVLQDDDAQKLTRLLKKHGIFEAT